MSWIKSGTFGSAELGCSDYIALSKASTTAPQARLEGQFSELSDVFSFECLLSELVSIGELPFAELDNAVVVELTRDPPTKELRSLVVSGATDDLNVFPPWKRFREQFPRGYLDDGGRLLRG